MKKGQKEGLAKKDRQEIKKKVRKNEQFKLDYRKNIPGCTKRFFSHMNKNRTGGKAAGSPYNEDRVEM